MIAGNSKIIIVLYFLRNSELGKENAYKHDASFLVLDIKKIDEKFQVGFFGKRNSFPFSIVTMPDKTINVPSNIIYSVTAAGLLWIAGTSNNHESFSTAIIPHIGNISSFLTY